MNERTAVIFGGGGFIGTHLARTLAAAPSYGRVVSADIASPDTPVQGVEHTYCDVREEIPAELVEGATDFFNLAAVHRTPGHAEHEYYETNVLGATNISEAARRHGVNRLVFTSSIAVYGPTEDPKTEASPLQTESAYGWSKLFAERIHQAWRAEDDARRLVIARPAVIFGAGENGNFTRLSQALRKKMFVYPGRKDTIKACGHVSELVRALLWTLDLDRRETLFNFCYPDSYSMEEICDTFQEVTDAPKPLGLVPLPLMMLAGFGAEVASGFGIRTDINRARIQKVVRSTNIVPDTLMKLGYVYETDLTEGMRRWRENALPGELN